MIALKRISEPAVAIVAPADVKLYGRISTSAQDSMLTDMITAATAQVEEITNRALITQTWKCVFGAFTGRNVNLPKSPLQSVVSAQYVNVNGSLQTINPAIYQVSTIVEPGQIRLLPGCMWPAVGMMYAEPITFTHVSGYGDTADKVPQRIKQAIIALAVFWYDNGLDTPVPEGIIRSLDNYRVFYET